MAQSHKDGSHKLLTEAYDQVGQSDPQDMLNKRRGVILWLDASTRGDSIDKVVAITAEEDPDIAYTDIEVQYAKTLEASHPNVWDTCANLVAKHLL